MRLSRWAVIALVAALPLAACDQLTGLGSDPEAPTNLTYQLIPSGDPAAPSGVLLTWEIPRSADVVAFNVYGRQNGGDWQLRATTTSPTYHDAGLPDDQYYVASRDADGNELAQSNTISIDRHSSLAAPQGLTSISLNGAIQLVWSSNAVSTSPRHIRPLPCLLPRQTTTARAASAARRGCSREAPCPTPFSQEICRTGRRAVSR